MTYILNFEPQAIQKLNRFREFIFVSDSAINQKSEPREQLNLALNSSWLAEVKIGNFVNIEQIYAPRTIIRQLKSLKFKPEQKVQLVSKSASGSVVVNINNSLIGMGAEIARRVVVTFVDEEK